MWLNVKRLRSGFSRCRGITLVELMVSIVVSGVVLGVVLGIFVSTRNGVVRSQDRLAMIDSARGVSDAVTGLLAAAVPPGSLDLATTGTTPTSFTQYQSDTCAFVSSGDLPGRGVELARVVNLSGGGVAIERVGLYDLMAGKSVEPEYQVVSQNNERFLTTARFRYAHGLRQVGLEANLLDSLSADAYPGLVEVRVLVTDTEGDFKPYEVVSAVRLIVLNEQ